MVKLFSRYRKFHLSLELLLWEVAFAVCFIFQFWRGSPSDGWIFLIFSLVLLGISIFSKQDHSINPDQVSSRERTALKRSRFIWVTITILFCLWELYCYIAGYLAKNEDAYPTVSLLVYPFTSGISGMVIFLLIYLWVGRKLFMKQKQK